MKLIYLIIVFHLPVWRWKRYRYLNDMPRWMQLTIRLRNDFERENELLKVFYWFKLGRFYIRKFHSHPMRTAYKASYKHLFVWKKRNETF